MTKLINKKLLPMKGYYFFFNCGTAPLVPFLTTYARQLGFSSVTVGLIYWVLPVSGMLVKPLMGVVTDHFKCQKSVVVVSILVCAIAFLGLKFSPALPQQTQLHFSCEGRSVLDTSLSNADQVDTCLVEEIRSRTEELHCTLNCHMNRTVLREMERNWKIAISDNDDEFHNWVEFDAALDANRSYIFRRALFMTITEIKADGKAFSPVCPRHISFPCHGKCNDFRVTHLATSSLIPADEVYSHHEFWIFLMLMVLAWIAQAICVSISDAICFQLLDTEPHKYGYQRLFGALGWGIMTPITGFLLDWMSPNSLQKNYTVAFYLAFVMLIIDAIVTSRISHTQSSYSSHILRDLGKLLTNIRIVVFLIWCSLIGMCTGLLWQFLFWLVEDLARTSQECDNQRWIKSLEGLLMACSTLGGEVPFFFMSGWILRKLTHDHAMTLIPAVISFRLLAYSLIPNPWYFLPVELTNGLTFGLFYACMASYASIVAPPGTDATMQGMVGAVFEGVGVSLGSLISGMLYHKYGGPVTFRTFGIGALIVSVLHALFVCAFKSKDSAVEVKYAPPKNALQTCTVATDQQELSLIEPADEHVF